eukprot:1158804-Pelagomonas_calceolata.AAC.2
MLRNRAYILTHKPATHLLALSAILPCGWAATATTACACRAQRHNCTAPPNPSPTPPPVPSPAVPANNLKDPSA